MKKLLFTTLYLLSFAGSFGQKWTSAYRFANVHRPIALESPSSNVVVIATDVGILHSSDTAETWDTAMLVTGLLQMECKGNNCYAITEKQFLKSADKGANWSALSMPMMNSNTRNLTMRVWSDNKVVLWIYDPSGDDSTFYTLDGGNSWINGKTQYTGAPQYIHTENTAFNINTGGASVRVTVDKGKTYASTTLEAWHAEYIIWDFLDSMRGFVSSTTDVSGDGALIEVKIRKTVDGGKTWTGAPWTLSGFTIYEQNVPFPPGPKVYITHFISESTGWFSAYYGNDNNKFMKTTDSGRTWTADTLGWGALGLTINGNTFDVSRIKHIKMLSANFGWAVREPKFGDTAVVLLKYGNSQDSTADTTGGSVNIDEIISNAVSVYPNPSANGFYTIQMPENAEEYTFKVVDLTGRPVGTVKENTVDLATAKAGIYILVITAPDNTVWYQKLVKE